jgi:hypothetical protein
MNCKGLLGQYTDHVNRLCHSAEIQNWIDCNHFYKITQGRFKHIQDSEKLLKDLLRDNYDHSCRHRGALKLVGEISKILSACMTKAAPF